VRLNDGIFPKSITIQKDDMNLYLTSAYKTHPCLDRVLELYDLDTCADHRLCDQPESADAILFIENTQFQDIRFKELLRHPLVKQYPEKVYMYNEMDRAWPLLPGLYCSLAKSLTNPDEHVAFPYLTVNNNTIKDIYASNTRRKWLYSFVGSSSHPIRKKMFSLSGDNARIVDTSEFCTWNPAQTSKYAYQKLYTDTMAASKFVLCPRGIGPASQRLFETMEAGRIPVIISDSWVEPPQVNWDFAVRVPESQIAGIPQRLASLEDEWAERSAAARAAWEANYSPATLFNTIGSAIEKVSRSAHMHNHSVKISAHKWRVIFELEARKLLKPVNPNQSASKSGSANAFKHSLISRLFSRKA